MADNITIDNGGLTDYEVRSTDVGGGKHVQHLRIDLEAPYNVKIDEGATYTYIGHAVPGTTTSSGTWRIKRLTNSDSTVLWADGNGNFDNVWDNRTSITYS